MVCMAGATVIGMVGKYQGAELVQFLSVMAVGILTAMLFGAGIGTYSRTQMMATSVTVPVMLVFSFLPMLSCSMKTYARWQIWYTHSKSAI